MTRQVIHLIPDVTLDDIRIDTLLERPSPHVSPIVCLQTRQPFLAPCSRYGGQRGHGGGRWAPGRHSPRHGPHNPK
ncbi:hypothetical protein ACLOJK_029220, partial [Asimina triloba]